MSASSKLPSVVPLSSTVNVPRLTVFANAVFAAVMPNRLGLDSPTSASLVTRPFTLIPNSPPSNTAP